MKYVGCSLAISFLVGCGSGLSSLSSSSTSPPTGMSGVVSAGPIGGATVTAYTLNSNGTAGTQLASAVTDGNGNYTLDVSAQSGPVLVVASGGSYSEEASGSSISMGSAQIRTVLPSTSTGQQVGITPVTEIAAQSALAAIATNASATPAAIISSSNATVASAMGLNDITIPPANPNLAASAASSTQAAQYAIVLASISQLAKTATSAHGTQINSLDMMQALATSFVYNGSFSGTVGAGAVAVPVSNSAGASVSLSQVLGGAVSFGAAMAQARNSITSAMPSGFNNSALVPPPAFNATPNPPTGAPTLALPAPPAVLTASQPTSSGPPPLPPAGSTVATSTSQVIASSIAGGASLSDSSSSSGVAMQSHPAPIMQLAELLLPHAAAATCDTTSSAHALGSMCNGADMTLTFGSSAASGCTNLADTASWSGSESLVFSSSGVCSSASTSGLGGLGASGSVTISSAAGLTRTLLSGASVTTDSNTTANAGFLSQPSGGYTVTCAGSGSGTVSACATSRTLNILGIHRAEYNAAQEKVFDHTLNTSTPFTITGVGASKSITAGVLVLQHNLAHFEATSTVTTTLQFSPNCCWPTGGSMTTVYSNGKTGTETLTFGSCGKGTLVNGSTTLPIQFTHCM